MKIRHAVTSLALATLLAPAAFAATTKSHDCASLQKEVDSAITANSGGPDISKARDRRAQGEKLCSSGQSKDGMKKLEEALKDAHVKAK